MAPAPRTADHLRRRRGHPNPRQRHFGRNRRPGDGPGGADPDRQLQRRVRPLGGRPDPHGVEVRLAGLPRQRLRVLPQQRLDANTWARNRPVRIAWRSATTSSATSSAGRSISPNKFNADKSKLFFLWSQEWVRRRREGIPRSVTVPSLAMRQGNFSELLDPTNPFFGRTRTDQRSPIPAALPEQHHPGLAGQPERCWAS
jgi:hypothetical protein